MVPPRQVARALPCPDWEEKSEPRYDAATPETFDIDGLLALGPKIPGTRCPTCALAGKEVWVIPGRCCGYCGTPCDADVLIQ
ncbi:hypothetical protein LMH87_002286 [Akanthomyces muscarius]|uniref:Uncharacterized protein n=1 Tax=Akanthomyces muscarius TaxID=2231603 RepID=A0A9W8Q5Z9_AKAMU|nr:hypothetical protein LMH87_002286 [Akanthomyces muscarius]KAJ4147780.1 hypothetical protein LMH87_002286 [Akanthomyces muscarius]